MYIFTYSHSIILILKLVHIYTLILNYSYTQACNYMYILLLNYTCTQACNYLRTYTQLYLHASNAHMYMLECKYNL